MKIEKFEDILAWQKAQKLTLFVYKTFRNNKDFGFKNQIERAAVSVMNNIAEGFERQTNKELTNFLFIAKGSCGEVRSMLYVALELKCITKADFDEMYKMSVEISKMLSGLIKTL
ncbi:MAG: four helix bundle protein [Candidatus Pacebacteria bacterium]|nr:four helix bundle protein [Candidatus Paceibacterota bacterium]